MRDTEALISPSGRHIERASGAEPELLCSFLAQVLPSLFLAGCGMVAAGLLLDVVQHWDLFIEISEFFILVPALLGLKGNLEMTMASRLSTSANLGELSTHRRFYVIFHNLATIQVQAISVGLCAALFSVVVGAIAHHEFDIRHVLVITASSVTTASIASVLLGSLMSVVVVISHSCRMNPDNIATPIAASLGDLVTLSLLCSVGLGLFYTRDMIWPSVLVLVLFLLFLIPLLRFIRSNPVFDGIIRSKSMWVSILTAVCISSLAGTILERFVVFFPGLAVLAPIINGLGGNLAAVNASRLSTAFHLTGRAPTDMRSTLALFFLTVPIAAVFLIFIGVANAGHTSITPVFLAGYSAASLVQVGLLLPLSTMLVRFVWQWGLDPDNIAIPFVTAFGDLFGTSALTVCFALLFQLGDKDKDVGD